MGYNPIVYIMSTNPFCKYKDMFGKPGSRKLKFMGIAVLDVSVVLASAIFIAWFFKLPYIPTIVGLFALGIVVHRIFCVRTAVDVMLFGK
jgi:hypothetical protein